MAKGLKVTMVGAGGFIGASLAERFARTDTLCVVDRTHRLQRLGHLPDNVRRVTWEPDDEMTRLHDTLVATDVLISLAWTSQPAQSMTGMVGDARQNIVRSLELFQYAAERGVDRIVFASSGGTVYGNVDQVPTPETTPLMPVSAYGVSKMAVERYLDLISYHYGVTGISLRIGNPYGPYQLAGLSIGLIANFLLRAVEGEPLRLFGDGETVRDYVWIEDLAAAVEAVSRTPGLSAGAYNVGSGVGHSINDVATMVEGHFPRLGPRIYEKGRAFDAMRSVLDTTKLRQATGWATTRSIEDGIAEMKEHALRGIGARS